MNFVINKLILWLKNKKLRTIKFEENKVNVITGDSGTGKSVIIDIFDYCFFASDAKIPEEKINENVNWYGVEFEINDQHFVIARGALNKNRKVSPLYFFSPVGDIPKEPFTNIDENQLKSVIEKEFSINSKVVIPYGGKKLRAGSKISFRYFFMFNTQSGDTIDHSEVFFDKQNDEKYMEALPRIFDLATGIDTVKNIIIKDKISSLEKDIMRLEKKKRLIENEMDLFDNNLREIVRKAKEYELIPIESKSLKEDIINLQNLVDNVTSFDTTENINELDKLQKKKRELSFKIRSFNKFKNEYKRYVDLESDTLDSLKPVKYIQEHYIDLIESPSLSRLLDNFYAEMKSIKSEISNKKPFDINLDNELKKLKNELEIVKKDLERFPKSTKLFDNVVQKYIFIGEIKSKLQLFQNNTLEKFNEEELENKMNELEQLKSELEKETVDKELVIRLLEELIQNYLNKSSAALGNYKDYQPIFNYKKKILQLKKPGSIVPSIVGSSSNHMFMHLCFMLGLHELIIKQNVPYVPNILILDQPSRPYYGDDENRKNTNKSWSKVSQDDKTKITIAFKVLNDFIYHINSEYGKTFQMIIFEHIPESIWKSANLKNVILVDKEFRDGNALIPEDYLS